MPRSLIFLMFIASSCFALEPLKIGIIAQGDLGHPLLRDSNFNYITYLTQRPLFTMNEDWEWQCEICKEIPTFENKLILKQKKFLLVKFHIKKMAKWANGQQITGRDFLSAHNLVKKYESINPLFSSYRNILSIKVDKFNHRMFTVKIRNNKNYLQQLSDLFPLPSTLEADHLEKDHRDSLYISEPTNKGLYNGPYIVAKEGNRHTILKRNPFYKETPAILAIKTSFYPNKKQLLNALLNKTIDLAPEQTVTNQVYKASKENNEVIGDSLLYEHLTFNLRNPILKDKNLRKALAHAIDKNYIYDQVLKFSLSPAVSCVHPEDPYFSSDVHFYPYDLEKSKKLLSKAGWSLKGKTLHKNNKPLKVELFTDQQPFRVATLKYIADQWQKLGVQTTLRFEGSKHKFLDVIRTIQYRGVALFSWKLLARSTLEDLYAPQSTPNLLNKYRGLNVSSWHEKKVVEIFQKANRSFKEATTKKLMAQFQSIYTDYLPEIPLYFYNQKAVIPKKFSGFVISGHHVPSSGFAQKWQLKF